MVTSTLLTHAAEGFSIQIPNPRGILLLGRSNDYHRISTVIFKERNSAFLELQGHGYVKYQIATAFVCFILK